MSKQRPMGSGSIDSYTSPCMCCGALQECLEPVPSSPTSCQQVQVLPSLFLAMAQALPTGSKDIQVGRFVYRVYYGALVFEAFGVFDLAFRLLTARLRLNSSFLK